VRLRDSRHYFQEMDFYHHGADGWNGEKTLTALADRRWPTDTSRDACPSITWENDPQLPGFPASYTYVQAPGCTRWPPNGTTHAVTTHLVGAMVEDEVAINQLTDAGGLTNT